MISKYVKEQKRYTQDELRKIFECTADETVQIIRKLKEYGIVKNVKKSDRQSMLSDLVEEDIRVTDIESGERELYYVFNGHELEKIQICHVLGASAETAIWNAQARPFWNGEIKSLLNWAKNEDEVFCYV